MKSHPLAGELLVIDSFWETEYPFALRVLPLLIYHTPVEGLTSMNTWKGYTALMAGAGYHGGAGLVSSGRVTSRGYQS